MAEAPITLAQAPNSTKAGLAQAKLRATLHHATRTLALQRAMWATKAQLQRQGLRFADSVEKVLSCEESIFSKALVRSWKNYVRAHMSAPTSNRRAL